MKPSCSRAAEVSATRPNWRNRTCSGRSTVRPTSSATRLTSGSGIGRGGLPAIRMAWLSSTTPSPATLKVPSGAVPRMVRSSTSAVSSSCRNWSRGSNPSTVGHTGSSKQRVSGLSTFGPTWLASRSTVTATSGRRRSNERDVVLDLDGVLAEAVPRGLVRHALGPHRRVGGGGPVHRRGRLEHQPAQVGRVVGGGQELHGAEHVALFMDTWPRRPAARPSPQVRRCRSRPTGRP